MTPSRDEIQQQLRRLLSSATFSSANRLSRFLQFVVDKALAGESDRLKEYVIGIEVFDRDSQYDPRVDSIVRVEAGRLRTKIQEYYASYGREDIVLIRLPKGGYSPEFVSRGSAELQSLQDRTADKIPDSTTNTSTTLSKLGTRTAVFTGALVAMLGLLVAAWQMDSGDSLAPAATGMRIAVLPFHAVSGHQADLIMAARLTERVTAELVRIGRLGVVSSTSALQFKDNRGSLRDVARVLQADLLMEGRLLADGDDIRVEVRTIAGTIDQKFWVDDSFVGRDLNQLARDIAASATEAVLARLPEMRAG
jgi:TolB-like protein